MLPSESFSRESSSSPPSTLGGLTVIVPVFSSDPASAVECGRGFKTAAVVLRVWTSHRGVTEVAGLLCVVSAMVLTVAADEDVVDADVGSVSPEMTER